MCITSLKSCILTLVTFHFRSLLVIWEEWCERCGSVLISPLFNCVPNLVEKVLIVL